MSSDGIFQQWLKDMKESSSFDAGMRIFNIQQSYNSYKLLVNYDEQIITLFKEVRNLAALGNRVPYAIKVASDEAKQNYPFAMTLREATRTYMQTCTQITGSLAPMMSAYQNSVQQMIQDGVPLKWDSDRIESYTKKFSEHVFQFQQKFTELESMVLQMDSLVEGLGDIDVRGDPEAGRQLMEGSFEKMQKMVDDMNLANFSNMPGWVADRRQS
jgi:dynein heavy chain 1